MKSKQWKNFIQNKFMTAKGVVVMGDGDSGDGLSKTSVFYYALSKAGCEQFEDTIAFHLTLNKLKKDTGHYMRAVAGDPHRDSSVSRDQYLDMWIALGYFREFRYLREHLEDSWGWVKSNGYRISKDILGPHHFGVIFRARKKWYHYPLLWLTDAVLLLNTIWVCFDQDAGRAIHNWYFLLQARETWPTLFSFVSEKLFKIFVNMGQKLTIYFNNGFAIAGPPAPPIGEMLKEFVEREGWGKYDPKEPMRWNKEIVNLYLLNM